MSKRLFGNTQYLQKCLKTASEYLERPYLIVDASSENATNNDYPCRSAIIPNIRELDLANCYRPILFKAPQ